MARRSKAELAKARADKAADLRIDKAFRTRCSGIAINIMDIPRVFKVGRAVIDTGADDAVLGDAVFNFVDTIRHVD